MMARRRLRPRHVRRRLDGYVLFQELGYLLDRSVNGGSDQRRRRRAWCRKATRKRPGERSVAAKNEPASDAR